MAFAALLIITWGTLLLGLHLLVQAKGIKPDGQAGKRRALVEWVSWNNQRTTGWGMVGTAQILMLISMAALREQEQPPSVWMALLTTGPLPLALVAIWKRF